MIRYAIDLYPSDDPRDGARLRRFTQHQSVRYLSPANGVGVFEMTLRGNSVDAGFLDPEGHQYVRVVEINEASVDGATTSGFAETVVGGAILDGEGDYEALTDTSSKLLTVTGRTLLGYLDNERMWSHTYIHGVFTGQDPIGGVFALHAQSTVYANGNYLGAMAWRVMYEGQHFREGVTYTHRHSDGVTYTDAHDDDKLESAIQWLVPTFTAFKDSSDNDWTISSGEFKAQVGDSILSVYRRLMEAGLYFEVNPDTWEISAWEKANHGRDRTGTAWGTNVIRFQAPTDGTIATGNILDDAIRGTSPKMRATQVLAGDAETYGSAAQAGPVPLHRYYPSDVSEVEALENIAETQLDAMTDAGDVARVHIRLGTTPTTGAYRPWVNILHDDLATIHNATGQWDWDEAALPVAAMELRYTRKTKKWQAWVHLGSVYTSLAERGFQDAMRQIIRQPGSHTHPPNPQLCLPGIACRYLQPQHLTAATATNGDLESGTTNWSGGSSSGTYFHGGSAGYAATSVTSADFTYDFGSQSFTRNVRYVLDIWRRMSGDHLETTITFGSEGGDEEATTYTGIVGDDDPALWDEVDTGADGQTWQRGRVCWTPSETRTDVRVRIEVSANGSQDIAVDDLALSTTTNNEYAGTSPKAARCDHTHHARSIPFSPRGDITATNVQTAIEAVAAMAAFGANMPWIRPELYGADPTGATYSDDAWDDALNSATDRGAAILAAGHYRFASSLILGNSTVILGIGANMENQDPGGGGGLLTYRPPTILEFDNNTHGIIAPDDAAVTYRCHHPVVENITVRGGGLAQGKIGVWLRDNASSSVSIQRVGLGEIRNCFIEYWGTAIDFDGTADSCKVIGGHIHDCDKGFVGGSSEDVFERVCVWDLATGPAVSLSGDRGQVIGCEIEPLVGSGIVLTSTAEYNRIVANDVKDVTGTAISVAGNNNVIVANTGSRSVSTYYADTGTGNEWGHNTPAASFPAASGGAPSGAAGGDLSGTYPNPSVVDDSHAHTAATAPTGIGPILITSEPAGSPLVFSDLMQNSEGTDLLYASEA